MKYKFIFLFLITTLLLTTLASADFGFNKLTTTNKFVTAYNYTINASEVLHNELND